MLEQPIFIVGAVRSGTTLLAQCMDTHAGITWVHTPEGSPELNWEWCELAGIEIAASGLEHAHCPPVRAARATPEIRQRLHQGFGRLFVRRDGAGHTRFLNKNPHLWNKLPFLRVLFPGARLVLISRDIRSTVLSTQMLWLRAAKLFGVRHYLPEEPSACWSCSPPAPSAIVEPARLFPGGSVGVLAEYWLRVHETVDAALAGFERPLFVRHRDLIADPARTLAALYRDLGLPPSTASLPTLDPHRNVRWHHLLATREKADLEAFIEVHRDRLGRLRHADVTL